MQNLPVVEVKNLYKSYNSKQVLKGIEFEVYRGEIFVLLGPNGAGKTTTVKILSGILKPDKGEVKIFSKTVSPENVEVKNIIGYLPDEPYIYTKLTGREFIEFICSVYKTQVSSKEELDNKYNFYLTQFELEDVIDDIIETYSKGMKQKLLLMSIFLRNPEIYILDEPLVGLDPKSISFFKQHVINLAEQAKTIILCTHLLDLAEVLATRLSIIYNGRILVSGSKEEIINMLNLPKGSTLENVYLETIKNEF